MKLAPLQITPELEHYMESLLPARPPVLERLEAELERENVPFIGASVGQLLAFVLRLAGTGDVLELGTATGYSAIWLASACVGRVITLESDPSRVHRARGNMLEAGLRDRVEVVEAEALDWLERSRQPFDCVFNDLLNSLASEPVVERCFELSLQRLRPGGLLIADNALRRGEVTRPESSQARNVDRYNRLVAGHPQLDSIVLAVRDGVSLARLKASSQTTPPAA